MPVLPIAAFLAGALLTLLLPVALLIALVVWYCRFSVRVPNTADGSEPPGSVPAATNPGPAVVEDLPPDPRCDEAGCGHPGAFAAGEAAPRPDCFAALGTADRT